MSTLGSIPVSVKAVSMVREAAEESESALDVPRPLVIFQSFGDNAFTMPLRCFVDNVHLRFPTTSSLNQAINEKFTQAENL